MPEQIWEPWQPKIGDYVRVERGPECQAYHAWVASSLQPVYGRVEQIGHAWGDLALWVEAARRDGERGDWTCDCGEGC